MAGISASRRLRRNFSVSPSIGVSEFSNRLVLVRSVRRLSIALNRFAEASEITEMRPAACSRPQESQALNEIAVTIQVDVARMTAFSSADTVRRFNMMFSQPPAICSQNSKSFDSMPHFSVTFLEKMTGGSSDAMLCMDGEHRRAKLATHRDHKTNKNKVFSAILTTSHLDRWRRTLI